MTSSGSTLNQEVCLNDTGCMLRQIEVACLGSFLAMIIFQNKTTYGKQINDGFTLRKSHVRLMRWKEAFFKLWEDDIYKLFHYNMTLEVDSESGIQFWHYYITNVVTLLIERTICSKEWWLFKTIVPCCVINILISTP